MAFVIKDRVKEITTSTGTGAVSLGTSSATFDTFQSCMTNGDTTYYAVVHTDSGVDEWEVGLGTFNTGNTLTRTTVLAGSNGTSVENFSAGNKDVFMTYPATHAALKGYDVNFADITVTGTVDGRDVATDGTKLDGIEASADVTDTTNVTAAGALMDSEVTNLSQVKAFDETDFATSAQGSTADSAVQPNTSPTLSGLTVDGTDTEVLITEDSEGAATLRFADTQADPSQSYAIEYDTSSNKANFVINDTNRAHFNSAGDYMVGPATATSPFNIYTANNDATKAGVGLRQTGYIGVARMDDHAGMFNRMGTDGLTLGIRNDGTYVGGLGNVGGELTFHSSTNAEAMRIDSASNVGIGTNNPATTLDVDGTVTATAYAGDGSGLTNIARKVWESSQGSSSSANYWAKVATYSITGDFDDGSFIYHFMPEELGAGMPAIIAVNIRTNNASGGDSHTLNVELMSKPHVTPFSDDSFKLIDNGGSSAIELWVKKNDNNCQISAYEMSAHVEDSGFTIAYNQNAAWQSSEPTGTGLNIKSTGVKVAGNFTATTLAGDGSALTGVASAAQGTTADAALPKAGGAMTGAITTNSTFDGRNVSVDGTKLDGIEASATADQTKADIDALNVDADTLDGQHGSYYTGYTDTAVSNLVDSSPATLNTLNELAAALGDDPNFATTTASSIGTKLSTSGGAMTGAITTNSTFDGRDVATDGTKLDGIEASADVTDTANVTAAGALMDSEVDADIKTLVLPASTTISTFGASLVDDADAATARTTLGLGTAATTAASAYATAAQGTLADSALQSGANNSLLTNDAGYTTNVGDITGVTAGSGITGGGESGTVTITHADTSSQASVNNSGKTYIQDITLDTYGHITNINSATIASSSISGLAYGAWLVTTGTSNAQNSYVASVADDNNWLFVKVHVGTYTTGAGTGDSPTVTRYQYRKAYRTFS